MAARAVDPGPTAPHPAAHAPAPLRTMAAARKKTPRKSAAPAARPAQDDEEARKRARKSASKGGTKSALAKLSEASTRGARPTNPDAMEADVIELITAVDEYKRKFQRPFPSWSEILDIVKTLGYAKSA